MYSTATQKLGAPVANQQPKSRLDWACPVASAGSPCDSSAGWWLDSSIAWEHDKHATTVNESSEQRESFMASSFLGFDFLEQGVCRCLRPQDRGIDRCLARFVALSEPFLLEMGKLGSSMTGSRR